MTHEVTLITGDGTGPELAEAARKCLDATGVGFDWDVREAGVDVMEKTGTPIPDATLESVHRTKCTLKAPITTPAEGQNVTYDLKPHRDDPTAVGTQEMAEAICAKL